MGGERQKAGLLLFADVTVSIHVYSDFMGRCMEGFVDLKNRTVERREGKLLSIWQVWKGRGERWSVCSCNFTKVREREREWME